MVSMIFDTYNTLRMVHEELVRISSITDHYKYLAIQFIILFYNSNNIRK